MSFQPSKQFLRPTFSDDVSSIQLDRPLIAVGHDEVPFSTYPEALRAQLHERHARIIREEDRLYIVALDEGAKTLVNGRAVVGASDPLLSGDVVQFGEELTFTVTQANDTVTDAPTMAVLQNKLKLLLLPKSEQGPAAPVAINEFPFLIAKGDGHFANYKEECPHAFGFLSRRHAHVYQMADALCVEDLGSTNGTRLNGELLGTAAHPLKTGDELTFGHPSFTFECVVIEQSDEHNPRDPEGTVLITSAGSFLDIYCDTAGDEVQEESADPPPRTVIGAADEGLAAQAMQQAKHRAGTVRDRLKSQWYELPIGQQMRSGIIVAVVAIALVLLLVFATWDNRLQDTRELLAAGQAEQALPIAASFAEDHPNDAEARQLLDKAFEQAVLPPWTAAMRADDYVGATDAVQQALEVAPALRDGTLANLLNWIVRLSQSTQPKELGPVTVARSNEELEALAKHWSANSDQYTRLLRRLADSEATVAQLHAQTTSRLRRLQSELVDQIETVKDLHRRLEDYLSEQRLVDAAALVARFSGDHPTIADTQLLADDLERYTKAVDARSRNDLASYLAATEELSFSTELFSKHLSALLSDRGTASIVNTKLARAQAAWQSGELALAISVLETTQSSVFDAAIHSKLERFRSLFERFNALRDMVQTEDYADAVISYYGALDESEDRFIYEALKDDFWNHKEQALAQAAELADAAASAWAAYQSSAEGISGGLRLEREVSDTYRQLAALLTNALHRVTRSERLYRLLEQEVPKPVDQHRSDITAEVRRQRSAISAMRSILERDVVAEKLSLLPEVPSKVNAS